MHEETQIKTPYTPNYKEDTSVMLKELNHIEISRVQRATAVVQ